MNAEGLADRHQGIADNLAADTAAHRGYGAAAREVIEAVRPGETFTADTIRERIPDGLAPHHPNVLPSVFGALASQGLIYRVSNVNASRRSRHSSKNGVWVKAAGVDPEQGPDCG